MITTIGVDPGVTGAIAIFQDYEFRGAYDMPVIGNLVDHHAIQDIVSIRTGDKHIHLEELGVRRGSAAQDVSLMGRNYGRIEAAVGPWPLTIVRPQVWGKAVGRPVGLAYEERKEWSRRRAIELWPDHHDLFKRKKDNGRAEAALIGYVLHQERLTKWSAA